MKKNLNFIFFIIKLVVTLKDIIVKAEIENTTCKYFYLNRVIEIMKKATRKSFIRKNRH